MKEIYNIQGARALAAISVVVFHCFFAYRNISWGPGSWGVDIFFVISGFIIPYVTMADSKNFLAKRIIRILPLYWLLTFTIFLLARFKPALAPGMPKDLMSLIQSLLFYPKYLAGSGHVPLLVVGWTLNYEMYFYAIFFVAILISKRWAPLLASLIILSVVMLTSIFKIETMPLAFYGNSITLEFVYGIGLYYLFFCTKLPHRLPKVHLRAVLIALPVLAIALMTGMDIFSDNQLDTTYHRSFFYGPLAFVFVCSLLALETTLSVTIKNTLVLALGEASYALYLLHPFFLAAFQKFWPTTIYSASISAVIESAIVVPLVTAAAYFLHQKFEVPTIRFLKRTCFGFSRTKSNTVNT